MGKKLLNIIPVALLLIGAVIAYFVYMEREELQASTSEKLKSGQLITDSMRSEILSLRLRQEMFLYSTKAWR
jgi:cytochrome c-type biogenesis protein CcmH/NrfF